MILPILDEFFDIFQDFKTVIDVYFAYFPFTFNFLILSFDLGSLRH